MTNNIIYSSNFKKWFGDWESGINCSKVVDNKGLPLIVHHGSKNEFNEFKSKYMGSTGTAIGQGYYFTTDKDYAKGFGENVKSFYLNIRKPLSGDDLTLTARDIKLLLDLIDRKQSEIDPEFGYGLLSDFGDIDYEGRDKILNDATKMLLEEDNDVELIGGLINMTNNYDLVVKVLRDTLGYDGIIDKDNDLYVVHHSNQIKEINNKYFNSLSNNFYESKLKKIIKESVKSVIVNKYQQMIQEDNNKQFFLKNQIFI